MYAKLCSSVCTNRNTRAGQSWQFTTHKGPDLIKMCESRPTGQTKLEPVSSTAERQPTWISGPLFTFFVDTSTQKRLNFKVVDIVGFVIQ